MTVLVRSLLKQSEFFMHALDRVDRYSQKIKTSLRLHINFVINLLVHYKCHTLLSSKMHRALVNTIHIFFIFAKIVCRRNLPR